MKKSRNTTLLKGMVLLGSLLLMAFSMGISQSDDDWKVPESARNIKNPVKPDAEGMAIAKSLYGQHCKSCHGKTGEGDGPKSEELDSYPGDFTTEEFQSQTDGEIFYKTTEGREDMPTFKKKIPSDEDRWLLVHYLRTLD